MSVLVGWFVFWVVVGGAVGYAIGQSKGRGGEGLLLGLLLGIIGWVIVALMEPSPEVRNARQAETIAIAAQSLQPRGAPPATSAERPCPWCAEPIKAAARVCRYCARDVEPIDASAIAATEDQETLNAVRAEFPNQYADAYEHLQALPVAPSHPAAWVRELCNRVAAGAPIDAAARRIPPDWNGPVPVAPRQPIVPSTVVAGDPNEAGEFPLLLASHPNSYDAALSLLAGLPEPPDDPQAWMEELCSRIDQGAPPKAAAARIPVDWHRRT